MFFFRTLGNAESGERAFYIVPLKALANEKVDELRNLADTVGLSVGIAIGDRDGESGGIENSDIVVCTSEKLDCSDAINPYGDGYTADKVINSIKSIKDPLSLIKKKFYDVDFNFEGG